MELITLLVRNTEAIIVEAMAEIIPIVKEMILDQKKKQFSNMGANDWDSTPFPDIQESTVRKKRAMKYAKPEQPLYATGELRDSLYTDSDPNDFDVYSDVIHAVFAEAWQQAHGDPHSFNELTDLEYDHVLGLIEGMLQDAISKKL